MDVAVLCYEDLAGVAEGTAQCTATNKSDSLHSVLTNLRFGFYSQYVNVEVFSQDNV